MKGLKKKYEQFRRAGAELVIISADSVEKLEEYRSREGASFVMLSDANVDVIKEYGLFNPSEHDGIAIPAVFLIDRSGIVKYSNVEGTYLRVRARKLLKEVKKL
ncbi:MAG: peroxiredoxin family protein [Candidatus Abyssubacteria bacterium]|nr:peroxiredoxin family protein [Candidatus Abyssubacteria bacterium]